MPTRYSNLTPPGSLNSSQNKHNICYVERDTLSSLSDSYSFNWKADTHNDILEGLECRSHHHIDVRFTTKYKLATRIIVIFQSSKNHPFDID